MLVGVICRRIVPHERVGPVGRCVRCCDALATRATRLGSVEAVCGHADGPLVGGFIGTVRLSWLRSGVEWDGLADDVDGVVTRVALARDC